MDTLTAICFTHYTWGCLCYSDRGESFHTCCMDLKADNNTWLFIRTSSWFLNRSPSLCVAVLPLRISFGWWSRHLIMGSRTLRIWSQIQHQQRTESWKFLIRKIKLDQASLVVSSPPFLLLWNYKSRDQAGTHQRLMTVCTHGKMQALLLQLAFGIGASVFFSLPIL